MPKEIVARIPRLPGYGVYAWEAKESTGRLTLWVRRTGSPAGYICVRCGITRQNVHTRSERRVRDLPWGTCTRCAVAGVARGRSTSPGWRARPRSPSKQVLPKVKLRSEPRK